VHLVVGDDLGFSIIVAGFGYMDAVSRPFVPEGCVRVIRGLEARSFSSFLQPYPGCTVNLAMFGEEALEQKIWFIDAIREKGYEIIKILRQSFKPDFLFCRAQPEPALWFR
jgi:hypothetical protein